MFTCPRCKTALNERRNPALGVAWICPACGGRAMTLDLLRRALPKPLVDDLWQQTRMDCCRTGRHCPACQRPMAQVPLVPEQGRSVTLDVCTNCYFVWFDPQEFETLPKREEKSSDCDGLSDEAKKALAMARLVTVIDHAQRAWH